MLNSTCMSSDFKVCFSVCVTLQYLELKGKCQKQNFIAGKYCLRFKLQFVIISEAVQQKKGHNIFGITKICMNTGLKMIM